MKLKKVLLLTGVFLALLGLIAAFLAYDSSSSILEVLPISLIPAALLTRLFWMYISPDYDFPGTWTWTKDNSMFNYESTMTTNPHHDYFAEDICHISDDIDTITDPSYYYLPENIYNDDHA